MDPADGLKRGLGADSGALGSRYYVRHSRRLSIVPSDP